LGTSEICSRTSPLRRRHSRHAPALRRNQGRKRIRIQEGSLQKSSRRPSPEATSPRSTSTPIHDSPATSRPCDCKHSRRPESNHSANKRRYVSTWPLICAAAKYSERVYAAPKGAEKDTHVSANWRCGTRAMVIKS